MKWKEWGSLFSAVSVIVYSTSQIPSLSNIARLFQDKKKQPYNVGIRCLGLWQNVSYTSNLGNILIVLFLIVLIFNKIKRIGVFLSGSLSQSVQHLINTNLSNIASLFQG